MRTIIAALAATLLLAPGAAQAATFLYTFTGTYAQGAGGATNVPFTMRVTVDSDDLNTSNPLFAYYDATGSLTAFGQTVNFTSGELFINNGLTSDTIRFTLGSFSSPTNYARLTFTGPSSAYSGTALPLTLASFASPTSGNSAIIPTVGAGMQGSVTSITIQPLATALPEPGSWAMMIGGFGLAGGMLRRRRKLAGTQPLYA